VYRIAETCLISLSASQQRIDMAAADSTAEKRYVAGCSSYLVVVGRNCCTMLCCAVCMLCVPSLQQQQQQILFIQLQQ
jgi:hypothetical protein